MKTETICRDVPCDRGVAERPRYYARQLITSDDLTLEQEYFRNRLRAHNRILHGWGVVCGAHVCPRPVSSTTNGYKPWEVVVKPGYILGPYGDEIIIDCERVVDLRTNCVTGAMGEPAMESLDPWCSQVYVPRSSTGPLYIAVKYKESQTRPVRVQPAGCSCDDNQCEYSRLRDGYEICVLDYCPEGEVAETDQTDMRLYLQSIGLIGGAELFGRCPPCPPEPWVVLARVTVDDDGVITEIDNCECRRIAISFGPYALRCHTERPTVDHLEPDHVTQGDQDVTLKIVGSNFKDGMKVNLGPGVTVDNQSGHLDTTKTPLEYTVTINVDDDARVGEHRVSLVNPDPDCTTSTAAGKFRVDAALTAPQVAANVTIAADATKKAPSAKPRKGPAAGRTRKNR